MKINFANRVSFYSTLSLLYTIFFFAIFGMQMYLNYSVKDRLSETITANSRGFLVVKSIRRLDELVGYHIESLRNFNSIRIDSQAIIGEKGLIFGDASPSLFTNQCIVQHAFFDTDKSSPLATFTYCFNRMEGTKAVIIAFSFVVILSFPLARRYRTSLQQSFARDKDAALGRITSQLSHDMRAPLGVFERLLHDGSQSTIESQKPIIYETLRKLYAMIESLRFADIEELVHPISTSISLFADQTGLDIKCKKAGIKLNIEKCRLEDMYVDPIKFERAWVNLASNAIDAAKSEVRIEVEIIGTELCLRVIDDGPGVPGEFIPKLFQRGMTYGKDGGSGLGLAYVRQIMQGHGGDVSYRRVDGLTIFECRLPDALESKKGQVVNNLASLEIQLVQKAVQTVAICLEPSSLSKAVLSKLSSHESDEFFFTKKRLEANIVVSNIESIMFEVLEADNIEFISVSSLRGDENKIVDLLKRKFNLA